MRGTSRKTFSFIAAAAAIFLGSAAAVGAADSLKSFPNPPMDTAAMMKGMQTAVLAGGCFWGMQGVFERLKGVVEVTAGYSGGDADTAHYEMVSTGTTGHAESIQIRYDPSLISYGTLLKVFFSVAHDPTELNFQGPDHGTQYRSVIFYTNAGQRQVAKSYIKELDQEKAFDKPIVTGLVPLNMFYPAEEYHQHYLDRNPSSLYIMFWDMPKIAQLKREYPQLVIAGS